MLLMIFGIFTLLANNNNNKRMKRKESKIFYAKSNPKKQQKQLIGIKFLPRKLQYYNINQSATSIIDGGNKNFFVLNSRTDYDDQERTLTIILL